MNSNTGVNNLEDIILSVCLLPEQDKKWIISRLSDRQQRILQAKLSNVSVNSAQWTALEKKDLSPSIDRQIEDIRVLLNKGLQTSPDKLLALFNDEPSWVRAYLMGQFPRLLKDALKDSSMKNKWSNLAGMDAIYRGLLTDMSCQAINEAIILKLNSLLKVNVEKKFVDYLDTNS